MTKYHYKKLLRSSITAGTVLLALLAGIIVYLTCVSPTRRQAKKTVTPLAMTEVLTADQALKDLDYYYKTVKSRHPAWKDGSKDATENFTLQYQKYIKIFAGYKENNQTTTVRELFIACWALANSLHDGHTYIKGLTTAKPEDILGTETIQDTVPEFSDDTNQVFFTLNLQYSTGFLNLKNCVYDEHYKETLETFFEHVNYYNLKNVAVDLRGNKGGDPKVALDFIKHLANVESYRTMGVQTRYGPLLIKKDNVTVTNHHEGEQFTGKVWILTDSTTYSAAMMFAELIQDNSIGHIVGFPSSSKPEYYGDTARFQMPDSKLIFTVSYNKYSRIDQSKKDLYLLPDYQSLGEKAQDTLFDILKKTLPDQEN